MNMQAQAYNQYKKATVETVAPEKLLLMLYEGAIKFIDNAQKGIEARDVNLAHQQIIKTEQIILELMSTLKMEYELSQGLLTLYEYLYQQLVQANIKKDIMLLEEVKGFLVELRDTWVEAIKSLKTPAGTPAKPEINPVTTANQANVNQGQMMNKGVPLRTSLNLQG